MFSKKNRLAAAVAITAMTLPAAANAAPPAAALSVSRAATPTTHQSNLGQSSGTLINLGIFAAIVAIILVATTTGGNDNSASN